MWKELFLLFVSVIALALSETQCRHNTECAADECCYYHEGPLLVSKRDDGTDVLIPPQIQEHKIFQGGWCEKYKKEGDSCSYWAKTNGHCECGPGLQCNFIADPLPTAVLMKVPPVIRRMLPWHGHSECQIDALTVS